MGGTTDEKSMRAWHCGPSLLDSVTASHRGTGRENPTSSMSTGAEPEVERARIPRSDGMSTPSRPSQGGFRRAYDGLEIRGNRAQEPSIPVNELSRGVSAVGLRSAVARLHCAAPMMVGRVDEEQSAPEALRIGGRSVAGAGTALPQTAPELATT